MSKYKEALEKAKAYDEALELMRDCVPDENGLVHVRPSDIFRSLEESLDERIRKALLRFHASTIDLDGIKGKDILAWLEKLKVFAEHGDGLYHFGNNGFTYVGNPTWDNVSWLEKQGENHIEQDLEMVVKPMFNVGDWIVSDKPYINNDYRLCKVVGISDGCYTIQTINKLKGYNTFKAWESEYHLWSIKDAKDGDVLACESGWTCIFKTLVNDENFSSYCFMDNTKWVCETGSECHTLKEEFVKAYNGKIYPATKEQCDTLMKAMADAGWEFDFEKKELKKIDNEEVNGEDYGIDGLYHAQRILEKTLGSVDGYQTDDGILDHKAAITAVKKLYEHKPTEWKQENREELTEFENAMMHIGGSFFGENAGLDPNDTAAIKEQAELLLELAPKTEWSEEDDNCLSIIIAEFSKCSGKSVSKDAWMRCNDFLNSLRDRVYPKQEWSEEDKKTKMFT